MSKPDQSSASGGKRLDSWKEIAAHLRRDIRTVQRWEKNERLPVYRKVHDKLASVFAYEKELDEWWHKGGAGEVRKSAPGVHETARRPRLAVLPLRNLSGDASQEYFSDGLTEELIGQLGQIDPDKMSIIARGSSMQYKHSPKSLDKISRELDAAYLLEGSVRRHGERVRITVGLIRASDQSQLWSESYDRDLRDILELQVEVARAVSNSIALKVSRSSHNNVAGARQVDPEAYNAYLRGRYFWNERRPESIRKALREFENAIERDPSFPSAYAGLADCHALLASIWLGAVPPIEAMPRAKAAARRALELDPSSAEAHASLGYAQLWFDWDWAAAERSFLRALELNPSYGPARQWYAAYLGTIGRASDSYSEVAQAQRLDPLSRILGVALGELLYFEGEFDRSIEESKRVLEVDPSFVLAIYNLGRAYSQKGRHREAIAELKRASELSNYPAIMMQLGFAYALAGKKADARKLLTKLSSLGRKSYVPSFYAGAIYTGLRETDRAFELMMRAREERCDYLVHLAKEPGAASLHGHPRFADLVPHPPAAA